MSHPDPGIRPPAAKSFLLHRLVQSRSSQDCIGLESKQTIVPRELVWFSVIFMINQSFWTGDKPEGDWIKLLIWPKFLSRSWSDFSAP
jgi:hypothetical protein